MKGEQSCLALLTVAVKHSDTLQSVSDVVSRGRLGGGILNCGQDLQSVSCSVLM